MLSKRKSSKKARPNNRVRSVQKIRVPPPIPRFFPTIQFTRTNRYSATAASNGVAITAIDLAQSIFVGTSDTTAVSLVGSVEVKKVTIWGPVPAAGSVSTVSAEFTQETTTFIGSPSKIFSDTSLDMTHTPFVVMKPPKNSLTGFWIAGGATSTAAVITLSIPANSIVDLKLAYTLLDQGSAPGQAVTVAAAVAGVLYFKSLQSNNLVAVNEPAYTP